MSLTNRSPGVDLERHLRKRPERPNPLPEVGTPEWAAWYAAYTKWVNDKFDLEFRRDHGKRR